MKIQKAFKYVLKPTKKQEELFAKFAGSTRFVFNHGLALIKSALDNKDKIPTYYDLAHLLPTMKRAESTAWLKEVHSQLLQHSLKDLESAIKHFWRRLKEKKGSPGFPRFKKKGMHDSFRYPQGVKLEENHVFLPKIGWVRYKNSRQIQGVIKQTTVQREGERWYVSIVCEFEQEVREVPVSIERSVGIDLGIKHFAYLSTRTIIENPRWLKLGLERLRKAQRILCRKKKGSKNRKKMVQRVARLHTSIKNKRKDFLHKQTTILVKNHDVVAVENLNVSGMIRNRRLARSIADAGWHMFRTFLKYKCSWGGKYFVEIDRFEPTSKKCSTCATQQDMPLSIRTYDCSSCGLHLDRDLNASINIRTAGLSVLNAC